MDDQKISSEKPDVSESVVGQKKKSYYRQSFLILLLCNVIYMIPHNEHYMMGGIQGTVILFITVIVMLICDVIAMFILAAILRWALAKQWAKYFKRAAWGALAVFFAVNVYRSTLPLPYLQYMIDKIPDAVAYFEENRAEFQVEADNGSFEIYYNDPDSPSGPMVNMVYVYVVIPELYPDKTGQISRTKYIHPLDGQWYLMLFQGFAM